MRTIFYILLPALLLAGCSPVIYTNTPRPAVNPPQQTYADQPQTDQVFYDELSPYGQWIDYPNYGYVWQPNVDPDFRPYVTNGQWVYSDAGWTWASNYSWGWAPFHYGRWFYDGNYGWLWEPGHQWAPAWVTWGQSGDYYGWAPVPPRVNMDNGGYRPRDEDWNFVPATRINQVNVTNYVVRNNVTVINKTTIINNVTNNNITNNVTNNRVTNNNVTNNNVTNNYNTTNNNVTNNKTTNNVVYNRGPNVSEVENITNTKIQVVKINNSSKPGTSLGNNQLTVYRPVIKQSAAQAVSKPAPQKVVTYNRNNSSTPAQNQRQGANESLNQNKQQNNGEVRNQLTTPPVKLQLPSKVNGQGNNQNTTPPVQKPDNGIRNNQNIQQSQKPVINQNQSPKIQQARPAVVVNQKPKQLVPAQQKINQPDPSQQNQKVKPIQGINMPKNAGKKGKDTLKKPKAVSRPPVVQPQN